jgi:hypothetical protein
MKGARTRTGISAGRDFHLVQKECMGWPDNVRRYAAGLLLVNVVDKEKGY